MKTSHVSVLFHHYEKESWLNTLKRNKDADGASEWSSSGWKCEVLSDPAATRRCTSVRGEDKIEKNSDLMFQISLSLRYFGHKRDMRPQLVRSTNATHTTFGSQWFYLQVRVS